MPADRTPRRPDVTTTELVGGAEAIHVSLHEYDERWPAAFAEHRRRIVEALAPSGSVPSGIAVDVEHIGSTSVPGLAAKPIVDIVVAVPDITAEEDYLDPLLAAGYELRVREPGHRLVRTPERSVHVHVYEQGAAAIDEYLLLRPPAHRRRRPRALRGRQARPARPPLGRHERLRRRQDRGRHGHQGAGARSPGGSPGRSPRALNGAGTASDGRRRRHRLQPGDAQQVESRLVVGARCDRVDDDP